jgi:hypothetical protein
MPTAKISGSEPTRPLAPGPERRDRRRFRLACPVRLLRDGRRIGESRTRDINCESFSCVLPGPGRISQGDVLDCEITLFPPPLLLRCRAQVERLTSLHPDGTELVCRLLGYQLV